MTTATMTSKGQITIPSHIRQALGVVAGDRVEFIETGEGQYALVAATSPVTRLKGMLQGSAAGAVSIDDMNAAIRRRGSSQ